MKAMVKIVQIAAEVMDKSRSKRDASSAQKIMQNASSTAIDNAQGRKKSRGEIAKERAEDRVLEEKFRHKTGHLPDLTDGAQYDMINEQTSLCVGIGGTNCLNGVEGAPAQVVFTVEKQKYFNKKKWIEPPRHCEGCSRARSKHFNDQRKEEERQDRDEHSRKQEERQEREERSRSPSPSPD